MRVDEPKDVRIEVTDLCLPLCEAAAIVSLILTDALQYPLIICDL
jgi:hypothetical protein